MIKRSKNRQHKTCIVTRSMVNTTQNKFPSGRQGNSDGITGPCDGRVAPSATDGTRWLRPALRVRSARPLCGRSPPDGVSRHSARGPVQCAGHGRTQCGDPACLVVPTGGRAFRWSLAAPPTMDDLRTAPGRLQDTSSFGPDNAPPALLRMLSGTTLARVFAGSETEVTVWHTARVRFIP